MAEKGLLNAHDHFGPLAAIVLAYRDVVDESRLSGERGGAGEALEHMAQQGLLNKDHYLKRLNEVTGNGNTTENLGAYNAIIIIKDDLLPSNHQTVISAGEDSRAGDTRRFYRKKRYLLPTIALLLAATRAYKHRALLREQDRAERRKRINNLWLVDRLIMKLTNEIYGRLPRSWQYQLAPDEIAPVS